MPKILLFIFLFFGSLFIYPQIYGIAAAQQVTITPQSATSQQSSVGFKITVTGVRPDKTYSLHLKKQGDLDESLLKPANIKPESSGSFSLQLCSDYSTTKETCKTGESFDEGDYTIRLAEGITLPNIAQSSFKVTAQTQGQIQFANKNFTTVDNIIIKVLTIPDGSYKVTVDSKDPHQGGPCVNASNGFFELNIGTYLEGDHYIKVYKNKRSLLHSLCGQGALVTERSFTIKSTGGSAGPLIPAGTTLDLSSSTGAALTCTGDNCTKAGGELCDNGQGVLTAIGCVHTDPSALIKDIFRLAIGIGGGIAFLLMVFGAFGMVTSAGNPDALKEGQQRFYSAIIGILFIVFSTLLLQIIGVDILHLEGFIK